MEWSIHVWNAEYNKINSKQYHQRKNKRQPIVLQLSFCENRSTLLFKSTGQMRVPVNHYQIQFQTCTKNFATLLRFTMWEELKRSKVKILSAYRMAYLAIALVVGQNDEGHLEQQLIVIE